MSENAPVIAPSLVYTLLYGARTGQRFTQDSPVLPEIWLQLARDPAGQVATLSVPYGDLPAHELARDLFKRLHQFRERTGAKRAPSNVSDIPGVVGAYLYLDEIVAVVLPMTKWWVSHDLERLVRLHQRGTAAALDKLKVEYGNFVAALMARERPDEEALPPSDNKFTRNNWRVELADGRKGHARFANASTLRLLTLLAILDLARQSRCESQMGVRAQSGPIESLSSFDREEIWRATGKILKLAAFGLPPVGKDGERVQSRLTIFTVSLNRHASGSDLDSVRTSKADAAKRLFHISCSNLAWAIVDSGVNPRHFAFRKCSPEHRAVLAAKWDELGEAWCESIADEGDSRVLKRFDLSFVYELRNRDTMLVDKKRYQLADEIAARCGSRSPAVIEKKLRLMADDLQRGRPTDWGLVAELVAVGFDREVDVDHGTHVAGVLGGAWPEENEKGQIEWFEGMCPDINLVDFKVTGGDGAATEYAVIAAMRLIRHMNEANDFFVVHGANLSLSIPHDVTNYACGRTPVCEEAVKLHKSGVVVVAAAGNEGYNEFQTKRGVKSFHTTTSITDPGNAEEVITVGATHRREPHSYGVSYFSSRGPTGDGRMKPDLVAPGEKILGPVGEGEFAILEGTSMAAPHVSGAAAMLMSRFPELIGQPERIKQVLCRSATDVGRERAFQGHGVVDILRALQSV